MTARGERLVLAAHPAEKRLEALFRELERTGFKAVVMPDNESALRFVLDRRPDALLVDSSNGAAREDAFLCESVRGEPRVAHTPIVFFAPSIASDEMVGLIRSGADRIVPEGWSAVVEAAWIERLCGRAERFTRDPGTGLYRMDYLQQAVKSLSSGGAAEWTLLLVKLSNLKAYNVCHGYEKGDALIADMAKLVEKEAGACGGAWEICGRWDSSTLAVLTPIRRSDSLAQRIVNNSNATLKRYFTPYEWAKGEIEIERPIAQTNKTEAERFPLVHLIVGGVRVPPKERCHPNLVFDHAKEVLDEMEMEDDGPDYLIEPL